jgi:Holliday junction resolvase RusA-like endonuclease
MTTNTFTVTIPLTPKPKASVRLSAWGGKYNPSARGMNEMRQCVISQIKGKKQPLMKGPVMVIVHFRLPAPSKFTHKQRRILNTTPHQKRPDGDNLEKFLNDALNGVVWEDDAKICILFRTKTYTANKKGSTSLFVRELGQGSFDYAQVLTDLKENISVEEVQEVA